MGISKGKKGLAANSIMLTFVRVFTYVSSIIQTMILSRALDKTQYGTYNQAYLVVSFVTPFLLLGLSNAVNYFYNQDGIDRKKYTNTIFTLVFAIGAIGAVIIALLRYPITLYFSNNSLAPLILIVAVRPLLQNLIDFFQVLYVSSGKTNVIAVRNTIVSLVRLAIVVVAAYLLKNIVLIYVLLVITDFVQVIVFHLYFNNKVMQVKLQKLNKNDLRPIFVYAIPLALSTAVGTISVHMDSLLIGRIMSTEDFAMYSNMAKELPFNLLVSSFSTVIFPRIIDLTSKGDKENMLKAYRLYLEIGILLTWTLVGGAIVSSRELLVFLYSDKYIEGLPIFIVYLCVAGLRFTYYGALLSANGKSKEIFKYSVFSLICNLVLNLIMFYTIGIVGPAIATFVSMSLTGFLQIRRGSNIIDVKMKQLFDGKCLSSFFGLSLLWGVIITVIKHYISIRTPVISLAVYMGIYCGLIALIFKNRIIRDLKELNRI